MARANKASSAGKKKSTTKKKTKQAASKQAASKKAASKKAASGTAAKKAAPAKKSAAKKATSKQAASKKAGGKKATSKKTTSQKAQPKKAQSKKAQSKNTKQAASKKAASKKTTSRSGSGTPKSSVGFDTRFLEKMRKLLVTERETYAHQAAQLRAEADSLVTDMDPGDVQFDEESGEGDTIAVERGRDLALASKALEMIEEIDHALAKFDDGSYGICEVSGEPIPKERLEAIPWARERVEYKVGGFGRR